MIENALIWLAFGITGSFLMGLWFWWDYNITLKGLFVLTLYALLGPIATAVTLSLFLIDWLIYGRVKLRLQDRIIIPKRKGTS